MIQERDSVSSPPRRETWSLNLGEIGHECPLSEGVLRYAESEQLHPEAPIFSRDSYGGPYGLSLFRQFLRHFWIEVHAELPPFLLIDSPPGFGKSISGMIFGKALDSGFSAKRLVYDGEAFMSALYGLPKMSVMSIDDAIASRLLFGRDWAKSEQKQVIAEILGHARDRQIILIILSQSGYELDRVVREDVKPWWVNVLGRYGSGPRKGMKRAELHHSTQISIPIWSHGRFLGVELGKRSVYSPPTYIDIPPLSMEQVGEYRAARAAGMTGPDDGS